MPIQDQTSVGTGPYLLLVDKSHLLGTGDKRGIIDPLRVGFKIPVTSLVCSVKPLRGHIFSFMVQPDIYTQLFVEEPVTETSCHFIITKTLVQIGIASLQVNFYLPLAGSFH